MNHKYTIELEHWCGPADASTMFIWCNQEGCPEPCLGDDYQGLDVTFVLGKVAEHESAYHDDARNR